MNAPSYNLTSEYAREGDSQGSLRITENGAYKGVLTKAKHFVNDNGTMGIDFAFESVTGATAYFQFYTRNNQGDSIFGEKQLNAVMTCMKVKSITPQEGAIEEFNFDTKKVEKIQATIFPALMNKPIGIVFQKEHYVKKDGTPGESMGFYTAFNAESQQTANEVLDQSKAERLEKILANLKDKNAAQRPSPTNSTQFYQNTQSENPAPTGHNDFDFDSDIPF